MRIIIILFLLLNFSNAKVVEITLKDFVVMLSEKYRKNVLIDKDLDTKLTLVSSNGLDFLGYFGMVVDVLDDNGLTIINKYNKYYYITKKKKFKYLLDIKHIDKEKLYNLAKFFNIELFQLDKTSYIVLADSFNNYNSFSDYVKKLDFSKTLRIVGTIYKTDDEKLKTAGIDVSVLTSAITNPVIFSNSSFASLPFTVMSGETKINGFLRYLHSKKLLDIVTRPDFVVLSGKSASFFAGLKYPIKKTKTTNLNTNTPLSSVTYDYIKSGLTIDVTPILISNNKVHLKISFKDSHITALDDDKNVITSENRYSSNMIVPLNKNIVIAGMTTREIINTEDKIPLLGDMLPFLFKKESKNLKKSNYIFSLRIKLE